MSGVTIPAVFEGTPSVDAPERDRAELRRAADAFESIFLQTLIERMREAQLDEGFFGSSAGSSVYEGMFDQYLAEQLGRRSPLGIADMLMREWTEGGDHVSPREAVDRLEALRARRTYELAVSGTPGETPPATAPGTPEIGRKPAPPRADSGFVGPVPLGAFPQVPDPNADETSEGDAARSERETRPHED